MLDLLVVVVSDVCVVCGSGPKMPGLILGFTPAATWWHVE